MSAAWAFLGGWWSAALFIGAGCILSRRQSARSFASTTQFAAEQGWPETQP